MDQSGVKLSLPEKRLPVHEYTDSTDALCEKMEWSVTQGREKMTHDVEREIEKLRTKMYEAYLSNLPYEELLKVSQELDHWLNTWNELRWPELQLQLPKKQSS